MQNKVLVVGAGFSGVVIARELAEKLNKKVLLIDKRNHIGGNSADEYDSSGVLIHKYGPHIFHTNSKTVFEFLSRFTNWRAYEHKVLASYNGKLYNIPVNRLTVNSFFGKSFTTDSEVETFLNSIKEHRDPVKNSEDVIVNKIGSELYKAFFEQYTKKQWSREAKELSPEVCGRVPVRFNDDCRYFNDSFQYMPLNGFTELFNNIINHKNITVELNTPFEKKYLTDSFEYIIYTGPVDEFFGYKFGRLPYRSINFDNKTFETDYYQSNSVINFTGNEPFTRITEYKYLTGQVCNKTTVTFEYPASDGEPYYPVLTNASLELYNKYKSEAEKLKNIHFLGRLATFRYYNMDQVVAQALDFFKKNIELLK